MTRRFLDDIRAEIISNVADNATGDITPADIRDLLTDLADSLADDEARLELSAPHIGYSAELNFAALDVFDLGSGDDGEFLNVDVVGSAITTTTTTGYSYTALGVVSIIGTNNVRYDMCVTVNGVCTAYIGSATGEGAGDPVSILAMVTINANAASDVIGLAIRTDSAGPIDITSAMMQVNIKPTNNP